MRDMCLPIMPHLCTKFRFYLIFSNCFYPRINLIKLKKSLSISFSFHFCIAFILLYQFANVNFFFFIIIINIIFMTTTKIFFFWLPPIEGKLKSICISLLSFIQYNYCKYLTSTISKE